MRILLPIPLYDYGRAEWGDSFEVTAFVGPLKSMGHDVTVFDSLDARWRGDRHSAAEALRAVAREVEPHFVLTKLMEDEVPLDAIRDSGRHAVTVNWFADDVWRFRSYSRHVAPAFTCVITTSRRAVAAYRRDGIRAIYLPWGFNPDVFHPVACTRDVDVAFVGQRHGVRGRTIERLRADGIAVEVWGGHWPRGRVATADLARTFSSAKINLNFLESSAGPLRRLGITVRGSTRADGALVRVVRPPLQMKARLVEIPACGAFQLTNPLPELDDLFSADEVVVARNYRELLDRISHYLAHDSDRESIARAGYERAVRDHSFVSRFEMLFDRLGLT
jgi:spore maturation protein CgeB